MSKHLRRALACAVTWLAMAITALGAWAAAGTETYSYDPLGRLLSVGYPNGTTVLYAYDPAGNRKSYFTTASTPKTDASTLSPGLYTGSGTHNPLTGQGFLAAFSVGTVVPTMLTGGRVITNFFDEYISGSFYGTTFSVSGFSADPGAAWLIYLTALGATRTGAGANYSYSGGVATWWWLASSGNPGIGIGTSGTIPCTIVHL